MENRIIKFKAKDVRGKWVEGDLCHSLTGELSILGYKEENGMGCFSGCHTIDPSTVCQFTGLKDKNGKLIYEGDIVDFGGEGEVVFKNGAYCVSFSKYTECLLSTLTEAKPSLKVICSKFDRKEGEK